MNSQLKLWGDRPTAESVLACFETPDTILTRSQVAEALQVAKGHMLIDLLEQLVADGHLKRGEVVLLNGVQAFAYQRT